MLKELVKKAIGRGPLVPTTYDPAGAAEFLPALRQAPRRPSMVPMRRPGSAVDLANAILERDEFTIQHHRAVPLARPVTWREDPLGDRNWRFWFQAGTPISYLLQAFEERGEARYLERATELVDAWIATTLESTPTNDMTWNDHSTALRAITLLYYWETWRGANQAGAPGRPAGEGAVRAGAASFDSRLVAALLEHGRILANEAFYMPRHNHGLDQSRALYALALNLQELPEAREWERLARERVAGQIRDTIPHDGVHFEHTPDYQGHVYMMLAELELFLQRHDRPWSLLRETTGSMVRYLTHCLKPNGDWPNLGDTTPGAPQAVARLMRERGIDEPEFLYALSGGKEGRAPRERDLLLPDSGYAIFRETWAADRTRQAIQLHVTAGFNTVTHKQHDDLSFLVHGFGLDLLVDGGKFKYDYAHPMRQFCESGWAHNTVVREDCETDLKRLNIGRSGITAIFAGENVSGIECEHRLWPETIARRLIAWVRPHVLLVLDTVDGPAAAYRQVFNLGPELGARISGNEVVATGPNGVGLRLLALAPRPAKLSLVSGQESPARGWVSRKHSTVEPVISVMSACAGERPWWATLIALEAVQDARAAFSGAAERSAGETAVRWSFGQTQGELRYRRGEQESQLFCGEALAAQRRSLAFEQKREKKPPGSKMPA